MGAIGNRTGTSQIRAVVKGMIEHEQEQKRLDVAIASVVLTTAGLVQPVTQHIIQGDGLNTRDGNQIILKDLDLVWYASQITAVPRLFRMICFIDTMNTGVLPLVTDVLTFASPVSGFNIANLENGRFKVLVDDQIPTVGTSATGSVFRRHRLKLNKRIMYLGSTFATAANGKNSIWVLTIADSILAADTLNQLDWALHFTDS
jgi:hypothetical protein